MIHRILILLLIWNVIAFIYECIQYYNPMCKQLGFGWWFSYHISFFSRLAIYFDSVFVIVALLYCLIIFVAYGIDGFIEAVQVLKPLW